MSFLFFHHVFSCQSDPGRVMIRYMESQLIDIPGRIGNELLPVFFTDMTADVIIRTESVKEYMHE